MKNLKLFSLLLTAIIIALSNTPILADNTYRYFYLYRNSDAYQDYHQEEDSTPNEDQEENDFQLYEEERDYYVDGDEEYAGEENYEDETEETYSGDNDDYQD